MAAETPTESPSESPVRAFAVAAGVCLVCSLVVAGTVVALRPLQRANELRERHGQVVALLDEAPGLAGREAELRPVVVELETGRVDPTRSPAAYAMREAAADPDLAVALAADRDGARIGSRPRYATAYLLPDGGAVLPVYGKGYLSTLWGYLALAPDGDTILGLRFYDHAETPGLGSEIESPAWTGLWRGKRLRDSAGEIRIAVVVGRATPGSRHEVDGISGATRTARGVERLIRFWVGPDGFGPFLDRIRGEEEGA